MKVNEIVHGKATGGENCLARRYIIGIERVPKIRGRMRRSLSGFVNGEKRWVRTKNRGG
jgi:hypothetical protein